MKCKYNRPIKQDNTETEPFTPFLEMKDIHRELL